MKSVKRIFKRAISGWMMAFENIQLI